MELDELEIALYAMSIRAEEHMDNVLLDDMGEDVLDFDFDVYDEADCYDTVSGMAREFGGWDE